MSIINGQHVNNQLSIDYWLMIMFGDLDMMASAQRIPRGFEYERRQLPFFSRYETEGSAGVEVFSPDVTIVPTSKRECFGFHFPPPEISGGCTAIPRREENSCSGK